jgi:hypothetical protein
MNGGGVALESILLPGAAALLAYHARELPQRDDLCGAFCGALALNAAGIGGTPEKPVDQDAVGMAAGSIVSGARDPDTLPGAETGRRDYRLAIPTIEDSEISGTTAEGVVAAVREIGAGKVEVVPWPGPWTAERLDGVFELAAGLHEPVTLIANLATHHLWGGRPTPTQLLDYMLAGRDGGPAADWAVGHFVCVVARTSGPGGSLYTVADTYPALGNNGVHLQPRERLALAIDRPDKPSGGLIAVVAAGEADDLRSGAAKLGLGEGLWDNGTVTVDREREPG